jgi:hypothetical protein
VHTDQAIGTRVKSSSDISASEDDFTVVAAARQERGAAVDPAASICSRRMSP